MNIRSKTLYTLSHKHPSIQYIYWKYTIKTTNAEFRLITWIEVLSILMKKNSENSPSNPAVFFNIGDLNQINPWVVRKSSNPIPTSEGNATRVEHATLEIRVISAPEK